jgi:hypothetical protein
MKKLHDLASAFYDAVWEFSTRICLLPDEFKEGGLEDINPAKMLADFMIAANPFLDLTGQEVPRHLHVEFDQIDDTVKTEVLPAYEILVDEWTQLKARTDQLSKEEMLAFGEKCAYLVNLMEMYLIPQTQTFIQDLELSAQPT